MTILSPTDLETADYNTPGWVVLYNSCVYKLNYTLLKINALLDVDSDGIVDGSILRWNAAAGKFKSFKI